MPLISLFFDVVTGAQGDVSEDVGAFEDALAGRGRRRTMLVTLPHGGLDA